MVKFSGASRADQPLTTGPRSGARVVALPQNVPDDAALVGRLLSRDPASVAKLFDRYADLLRGLLTRMLGGTAEVDDLIQETFLIVIAKIRELRRPEALRSFVVSVAIGVARNELRKRAARRLVRWSDAPPPSVPHACEGSRSEPLLAVYRVLDRLDAASRIIFVMRHVEGWDLADIAEAQNCSLATIKRRLQKTEERFRAIASREAALHGFLEDA